jgi:hypothetical protein
VHLFWSSHEEKRTWLSLSMGSGHGQTGAPWEAAMGACRRGRERGGEGERGARLGVGGTMGGGLSKGARPCQLLAATWLLCEVEENT